MPYHWQSSGASANPLAAEPARDPIEDPPVPTYQYACTECGHAFDQAQSFSDDALTECPVCSGRLRKVFNAVGVVFKGSGFYRTDSRTNGSSAAPAGSDASPAPAATGAKKASGGDAKPPASTTSSTASSTPSSTPSSTKASSSSD